MPLYRPESLPVTVPSAEALRLGQENGQIFQAMCQKCDEFHNLHVDLGPIRGLIPREETALGIAEGTLGEFAILALVGKPVSFQVLAFDRRGNAILSRRSAQAEARDALLERLHPGDVLPAVVQNPARFGAFCDIGCGFAALLGVDRCCISRLRGTSELLCAGQSVFAAVLSIDHAKKRVALSMRELLGTWEENAARFRDGQTVLGTVRSILPYGTFVELTPNLSGLAESRPGAAVGDTVSVYIRAILPQKHKIKLDILQCVPPLRDREPLPYAITSGRLSQWEYYPGSSAVTYF